jgi:hypothetical protein
MRGVLSNSPTIGGSDSGGLDPVALTSSTAGGEWRSGVVGCELTSVGGGLVQLVPMPAGVEACVQRALYGPGAPSQGKAWLWVAGVAVTYVALGYIGVAFVPLVDAELVPAGNLAAALSWFLLGPLLIARVRFFREVLCDESSLLHGLLQAEVTPEAAAAIAAGLKAGRAKVGAVLPFWVVFISITYIVHTHRRGGLTALEMVGLAAFTIGWPAAITARKGSDFIAEVARVVVVDRVRQLADRARRSTPSTLNFEGILEEIAEAQNLVSAASVELALPMVLQVLFLELTGMVFIFCGSGPQPLDPAHLWNYWHLALILKFTGTGLILSGIWGLMQGAKITSACEDLGDAINQLRLGKTHGDTAVHLPSDPEKLAIEHLHNYVRSLNRGRGMGFVISKKRISHSFVLSLTLKVASAVPFFFAIIISLWSGEERLVNATRECCAC